MGTTPAPLFDKDAKYTDVNKLASMVVDNMPIEGTWFYVNSGMTSNIIFPDFNISKAQAKDLGATATLVGTRSDKEEDIEYTDSLLAIPGELLGLLEGGSKSNSSVKVLDLPGSDYDGADIFNVSIDVPIGTFAFFTGDSAKGEITRYFSMANAETK